MRESGREERVSEEHRWEGTGGGRHVGKLSISYINDNLLFMIRGTLIAVLKYGLCFP